MKPLLFIAGLIIYNIYLFFVSEAWLLAVLTGAELLCTVAVARRDWRGWRSFMLANSGFVLFVILCNLLLLDAGQALLVGVRLWLAISSTYIVSRSLSAKEFAGGIAKLCAPLSILGFDTKELALSITIALTFVPLFANEARALQDGLRLKGYRVGIKSFARQPQIYVSGMLEQLFCYAEHLEQALRLKGYD